MMMGADEADGWRRAGKGRVTAATKEPEAETRGGLLLAESGMSKTEVKGFAGCRCRRIMNGSMAVPRRGVEKGRVVGRQP